MSYEFLEHTADIKFRVKSENLKDLFMDSANAVLFIVKENKKISTKISKNIIIKGDSLCDLLYNFLEDIIFLLDSENFIISKISKLEILNDKFELKCVFVGDNIENYKISNEIKAITYNQMKLEHKKDWLFECVLDV